MILLRGGRVVDPGTELDSTADVLVSGDRVLAVGTDLRAADAEEVDVTGLVVGPGFIDLHSHVHSVAGQRLQAMDGVTTALDLEAGLMPIARAYDEAARAGRPLNYGFSASWGMARAHTLLGIEPDATFASALAALGAVGWQRDSTPTEQASWLALLEGELSAGALGIGIPIGYAPRIDPGEYLAVARLAAAAGAPTFTHVRELIEVDPTTPIDGSSELVIAAAETGAAMHHCHVNSTSRRHTDRVLGLLERSTAEGSRVTVEAYPYGAGSTGISAYFLDPDRLHLWGITPANIVVVETGERIADAGRLRELRRSDPGATCIVEYLDENDPFDLGLLQRALAFPDSIVASDAMPVLWPGGRSESLQWPLPSGGHTHPRTAGTFGKALRLMVRETGLWTWSEAFRRCAYLPARILDDIAPAARSKGHLGIGADADIVVLDPNAITDQATYFDSTRPTVGVRQLLVGGSFVVRDGDLVTDAFPGRALRGQPA
jgi:hypothetical protein